MSTGTLEPEPPAPEPNPRGALASSMRCEEIFALTRAFLTGELSPERGRVLRAHLDRCGPCRDEYRGAVMTAASLGGAQRRARLARERAERRADFRRLASAVSGGPRRRARNWRLILYPLVVIVMLTQLSRVGRGGGAVLRAEVLAGQLDTGRTIWTAADGLRPMEAGQRVRLSPDGSARLTSDGLSIDLAGGASLLVVGRHPLRLRHEAGSALLRGEGSLVTRLGVVDVLGGSARLTLGGEGLLVESLAGHVFFFDAEGAHELAPGQSLRVQD